MPFVSKAQARHFKKFLPHLYDQWMRETKDFDSLPEHKSKKKAADSFSEADTRWLSYSDDHAGKSSIGPLSDATILGTKGYTPLSGQIREITGHGGGTGENYSLGPKEVGPRSATLKQIIDRDFANNNWSKNPSLLIVSGCNKDGCDVPAEISKNGVNPERLVYTPPGHVATKDATTRAAAWAALEDKPWLWPSKQTFRGLSSENEESRASAEVRPYIEPKYWIPGVAAVGAAAMLWYFLRNRKKRTNNQDQVAQTADAPPEKKKASALLMAVLVKNAGERGLWDNVHAKRRRGEAPAKPGDKDYPDSKSFEKSQEL